MSTQQDVKPDKPPVQGEEAKPSASPASAGTPAPDFRADIVKALAAGSAPDGDPPEAAPTKPAEPEKAPEAPTTEKPAEKPPEPPKAEEPPAKPKPHPLDEEDDFKEDEVDPKFTKIRAGIDKLRTKLRKAREHGQLGSLLSGVASKAGMTPELLAKWVELGAGVNTNDPRAVAQFADLSQRLGIKIPAAAPAEAPKPAEPQKPDEGATKALADRIYQEDFAEDVGKYLVSEEVARAKAVRAANRVLSQTKPQQPPAPLPPEVPTQGPNSAIARGDMGGLSPLEKEAVLAVHRMEASLATQIPDWNTKLKGEVQQELHARRQKDGGISPVYWLTDFVDAVNTVRAKHAPRTSADAPTKVDDTLKSTRRGLPQQAGTPKQWDGTGGMREQIAQALHGGGTGLDELIAPQ